MVAPPGPWRNPWGACQVRSPLTGILSFRLDAEQARSSAPAALTWLEFQCPGLHRTALGSSCVLHHPHQAQGPLQQPQEHRSEFER